jgi:hypothetical protein
VWSGQCIVETFVHTGTCGSAPVSSQWPATLAGHTVISFSLRQDLAEVGHLGHYSTYASVAG